MRRHPRARGPAVVVAGVLTLGACIDTTAERTSSGSRSPAPHGAGAAPAATVAAPVTVDEYRTRLNGTLGPLDSALKQLGTAKGYKGLAGRIGAVGESAADALETLEAITPPAEAATEHRQMVEALREFKGDTGVLDADVDDRELCTGALVRAGLGKATATGELRDALREVAAKVPGARDALTLPSARAKVTRPPNGSFIRDGGRGGRGTLTIDNGSDGDAVIKATRGGRTTFSVYVRRGRTATVSGVSDGTYRLYFTGGSGWDPAAAAFGRDCAFQKFDDTFRFKTTYTSTQVQWSTWKISLQPVVGGNASTSDVAPDSFPG